MLKYNVLYRNNLHCCLRSNGSCGGLTPGALSMVLTPRHETHQEYSYTGFCNRLLHFKGFLRCFIMIRETQAYSNPCKGPQQCIYVTRQRNTTALATGRLSTLYLTRWSLKTLTWFSNKYFDYCRFAYKGLRPFDNVGVGYKDRSFSVKRCVWHSRRMKLFLCKTTTIHAKANRNQSQPKRNTSRLNVWRGVRQYIMCDTDLHSFGKIETLRIRASRKACRLSISSNDIRRAVTF